MSIVVEGLEYQPQLLALLHGYDIERRTVENDVGPFARLVDFDAEAIEIVKQSLRLVYQLRHGILLGLKAPWGLWQKLRRLLQ